MRIRLPDLSASQLAVVDSTLVAVRTEDFDGLPEALGRTTRDGVWLPPPVLEVAAALIAVTVEPETMPLELDEGVWDAFLRGWPHHSPRRHPPPPMGQGT